MNVVPNLGFVVRNDASFVKSNMPNAEEKALKEHAGMLKTLAKKYARTTRLAEEDLEQEAAIAFVTAFRSWTPGEGRTLESWAFQHIERRLIDMARGSNTENKHRTDPPPASGRGDDKADDVSERMDLIKDAGDNPEEAFANAEERRALVRLMSILSPEDRQFLLQVKELGPEGYVKRLENLEKVPAAKRMAVSRRAKALEAQLVEAAQKWSA